LLVTSAVSFFEVLPPVRPVEQYPRAPFTSPSFFFLRYVSPTTTESPTCCFSFWLLSLVLLQPSRVRVFFLSHFENFHSVSPTRNRVAPLPTRNVHLFLSSFSSCFFSPHTERFGCSPRSRQFRSFEIWVARRSQAIPSPQVPLTLDEDLTPPSLPRLLFSQRSSWSASDRSMWQFPFFLALDLLKFPYT